MMTASPELVNRVKQEYLEMPGLVLTARQASRLWNLETGECQALFSALVREEFLAQTQSGAFLRRGSGPSNHREALLHGSDNAGDNNVS